jgi:hypothetical protein
MRSDRPASFVPAGGRCLHHLCGSVTTGPVNSSELHPSVKRTMRDHWLSLRSRSFVRPMLCGRCRLNRQPSNWPTMFSAFSRSRQSQCCRTVFSSARKMDIGKGRKPPGWCTVMSRSSTISASRLMSPGCAWRRKDAGSSGWSGSKVMWLRSADISAQETLAKACALAQHTADALDNRVLDETLAIKPAPEG